VQRATSALQWDTSLASNGTSDRPRVAGKFIFVGDQKYYVRGVTYGTFRPRDDGSEYPDPATVERDFRQIVAMGGNTIRTYTVPPRWLLNLAQRHGLRILVGLPWEQHITFLDDRARAQAVEERVRAGIRSCAGHPAILGYAIGNEIPSPIVRWCGRRPIEQFLERLYRVAKAEDPDVLVTYVNYPSTEYLQLPFLDLVCFNVYLEAPGSFAEYVARLHNLAGDRPLLLAEIGLDSRRHGEDAQAQALDWQIRASFTAGCAGLFVFAWTDEWHRGGYDVDDWDFGLTRRDRSPKHALWAVRDAFSDVPCPEDERWPRISVVVCSHNGARTIGECCRGLQNLVYPNFEVIVVDDGSTDSTGTIASQCGFRVIRTENRGLSNARNTGLEAATGEIIAYLDDDAYPDPHWLTYLALTFLRTDFAAVGGPNIPPPGDGLIADCVANAPGGPMAVLLSDREAEHLPGCNMAFRRAQLEAVGGFDPQYRTAGDDVDVCWRLRDHGLTLGFHPGAAVWHHRRSSIRGYWRQQVGYGKAEALLERKWPEKYNAIGHLTWSGRLYGQGFTRALPLRPERVYHGTWGTAPFQSLYQPATGVIESLPLMPEWYLAIVLLALISCLGVLWRPLYLGLPLLVIAIAAPLIQACSSATRASFSHAAGARRATPSQRGIIAFLHLLQPLARLIGRLSFGLTLWRRYGWHRLTWPLPRTFAIWSERWLASHDWITTIRAELRRNGVVVRSGESFDHWDLEVLGGTLGFVRVRAAVEEHGEGKQLVRVQLWPQFSGMGLGSILLLGALGVGAALDRSEVVSVTLGGAAVLLTARMLQDCAGAMSVGVRALRRLGAQS
jgi:GT2 family glycosyltransferase